MSISIWDLFKYIYKWKIVIALITLIAFAGATVYVNRNQTYNSKIVIQYLDKCVGEGKNLNGDVFDANEIKSPTVILNVLKDLGYKNRRIESIRENISIAGVTPKSVENLKTSKEKLGEEYVFYPKTYTITYHGNSSYEETRDTLTSIVSNYFRLYSENYLYLATLNEVDYDVNKKIYDFLEQAEEINENLKQTIDSLTEYAKESEGFRSSETGLTFKDLLMDFQLIKEYSMPKIFSRIYENHVSLDEELLISKYTERMEKSQREMDNYNYKAELTENRMDVYSSANKDTKTYNEGEENGSGSSTIMRTVEYDKNGTVDEQTTYDNLIVSYSGDKVAAINKAIDVEYCRNVIEKFRQPKDPELDEEYARLEVVNLINDVLSRLSDLYKKANINIESYNSYVPTLHIKKMSGVYTYGNISGSVYKLIAVVGGFTLACIIAIVCEIMKRYALYSSKIKEKNGEDPEGGEAEEKE